MREENGLILSNTCIAKDTYKMMIQAEMAKDMQPGQFVNLQIQGYFLRRPISISYVDDEHCFTIVYKV
ncbi:hypothetical protein [Amedibacillus dolichus]